jgi:hyperosmotically inducible periplasmic protein
MQIKRKPLGLALCLWIVAAVAGLTGCQSEDTSSRNYIDDRMVASRVKVALTDASNYKFPAVNVTSFNGTVQLNGIVATEDQRQQAAKIASHVEGVRQLVNNISLQAVSPTGRIEGPPISDSNSTSPPKFPPLE